MQSLLNARHSTLALSLARNLLGPAVISDVATKMGLTKFHKDLAIAAEDDDGTDMFREDASFNKVDRKGEGHGGAP